MHDVHLERILGLVRDQRNLDFSNYREGILNRRVMARVRMVRRDDFEQYYAYLKFHPTEIDLLMDALTINVTEFFRDAKVFDAIERKVIPAIFEHKKKTNSRVVNVWSCGSSSGEEAYSALMLVAEYLGPALAKYRLTINGTDIDGGSLSKAQEGVYEKSQFKNLSPARRSLLEKYFYDMGNQRYWVREEWVSTMRFFYHDVTADVPLENMDLVLCRNMLIYFERNLQDQVLGCFWQALRKGGFLVLGIVESIMGSAREKYLDYDRDARIYVKKEIG